jgi:malate/lactate dehydrogenase
MNYYLKNLINTKEEVDCVLLGEHGESAFVSHQLSTIGHKSIDQAVEQAQLTATLERTKGAAKEIKETEQATIYGVSFCAIKIFESLLEEETIKIPVSTEMPEWLCTALEAKQIFLSLYSKVNKQGAKVDEDYCPNKEELAQLKNSYEKLIPLIPKKYL